MKTTKQVIAEATNLDTVNLGMFIFFVPMYIMMSSRAHGAFFSVAFYVLAFLFSNLAAVKIRRWIDEATKKDNPNE